MFSPLNTLDNSPLPKKQNEDIKEESNANVQMREFENK